MFTYNHFRTDLLPISRRTTDSTFDQFVRSAINAGVFGIEFELTQDEFSSTARVSWNATTYPRSVTSYAVSTFQSTASTDGGNGGETVGSAALGAYSTGVDSHTFSAPATQTYSFTTEYFSNTAFTLSASATATRTTTGSRTLTITGVTTLVPAALEGFLNETRWFVARQMPFGTFPQGLRRVALAYGIGEVGTTLGSRTVASLATGEQIYNSSRFVSTSTSTANQTTKYIRRTFHLSSEMGHGRVSALRRYYAGHAFFGLEGTTAGAMTWNAFSQMISPTVAPDFAHFVSVAPQLYSRRIFTKVERSVGGTHYSISGSSALLVWSYLSSSWQLLATLTNNSTSTTTEISLLTSASAVTTTLGATTNLGLSTVILGPRIPFSASGFLEISVTQSASINTSRTFVLMSGSGTSGTASSASTTQIGSTTFSFSNGTTNSNLPSYVSVPAISISTSSVNAFAVSRSDVTIYPNSKWNEASRGDSVSVIE